MLYFKWQPVPKVFTQHCLKNSFLPYQLKFNIYITQLLSFYAHDFCSFYPLPYYSSQNPPNFNILKKGFYSDVFLKAYLQIRWGAFSYQRCCFLSEILNQLRYAVFTLLDVDFCSSEEGSFKGIFQNLSDNCTGVCIYSFSSTAICFKCIRMLFIQIFQYTSSNHCSLKLHLAVEMLQIEYRFLKCFLPYKDTHLPPPKKKKLVNIQ